MQDILQQILDAVRRGSDTAVIFDIDDTLFRVNGRTLAILKYLSKAELGLDAIIRKKLGGAALTNIEYGIKETLTNLSVDRGAWPKIEKAWAREFFSGRWLDEDKPIHGAIKFVNDCQNAGAKIIYLSGRDVAISEATRKQLSKTGFPLGHLHFKSPSSANDVEYKIAAIRHWMHGVRVIAFFDNMPDIIKAVKKEFPDIIAVQMDTAYKASQTATTPKIITFTDSITFDNFLNNYFKVMFEQFPFQNIFDYINKVADRQSTGLGQKLISQARDTFLEGQLNGWSNKKYMDTLTAKFPETRKQDLEAGFQTAMTAMYNAGAAQTIRNASKGVIPAVRFKAVIDKRTTPICLHMDGKVWSRNDDSWERFIPPLHWRCLAEGSTIFTDQGFKNFRDLKGNEFFASLNPETLEVEYVKALRIIRQQHDGELIEIKSQNFNIQVTPDHQMAYVSPEDGAIGNLKIQFCDAQNLGDGALIPTELSQPETIWWIFNKEHASRIPYNGPVYCVELEKNHIFYAEFHGKCCWVGNCRSVIIPVSSQSPFINRIEKSNVTTSGIDRLIEAGKIKKISRGFFDKKILIPDVPKTVTPKPEQIDKIRENIRTANLPDEVAKPIDKILKSKDLKSVESEMLIYIKENRGSLRSLLADVRKFIFNILRSILNIFTPKFSDSDEAGE